MAGKKVIRYTAAGGVVVDGDRVLVLHRSSHREVRLPKGHVEPGESLQAAAVREVAEESGYQDLTVLADLGVQEVEFDYRRHHVHRREHFFLMRLNQSVNSAPGKGEAQFEPEWLPWETVLKMLTFEAEREWVRRARRALAGPVSDDSVSNRAG